MGEFTGDPRTNWSNSAFVAEALIEMYPLLNEQAKVRYFNAYKAAGEVLDNFEGGDYDEDEEE